MRYLGGKSKIAKQIAAVVAPKGLWWEPFCGGLAVSRELVSFGPGLVSDANEALIFLYRAVRAGWIPPEYVSRDEWEAAKTLPNSNPMKAFAGVGCSYLGMWFKGYEDVDVRTVASGPQAGRSFTQRRARAAKECLLADIPRLSQCDLEVLSFFDISPVRSELETIYCDPPYAGTLGYDATAPFDHCLFWEQCRRWAELGVRVFVSELSCSVRAEVVWEKEHVHRVSGTRSAPKIEKLFRVLP